MSCAGLVPGQWVQARGGRALMVVGYAGPGVFWGVPLCVRCAVPVLRHLLPKPKPRLCYVQDMRRVLPVPGWDAGAAAILATR